MMSFLIDVLSAGLDSGLAVSILIIFFAYGSSHLHRSNKGLNLVVLGFNSRETAPSVQRISVRGGVTQ